MTDLTAFDHFLTPTGPAALVLRQHLSSVEGDDGVVFPATYASGDNFKGGYNIDRDDRGNVCLIDSVGAQANRVEPMFAEGDYRGLVPQVTVKAGERTVNLLDASHRAADALVRCSSLQDELQKAFAAVLKGDAEPLAKIAPTSLVFGVWDSRGTQAKLPRLFASTIRAFDVRRLRRSAQYCPPIDYAAQEVFSAEDKAKAEGDAKSPLAQRGFVHVPAAGSHGGVIADGGVRRDATLGFAAIRGLHAGTDAKRTEALRRYILGLSLVAFTYTVKEPLRQGCTLVRNPDKANENECVEVYSDGKRVPFAITHDEALEYALAAAKEFGVAEGKTVPFEAERAKKDVKGEGDTKTKPKKAKKVAAAEPAAEEGQ